ncbi:fumarylacetoacetate hydrolase family protein [Cohnella zeiphila]|uniref:Fumarylacetoacetate hydrolase family protein n=1 Tax=Cohnella zeiphila TaxID=2761120 RepID=A0A7X0SRB6_9BACL|nr:fumarylacetoacetate hydrolase family protein [Cohnella zeiphila]MBB6734732.1 fumarylacetoacetate hydrolase family protein [Cohnella zeiphila]
MLIFRYRDGTNLNLAVRVEDGSAYRLEASDLMALVRQARAAGQTTEEYVRSRLRESRRIEAPAHSLDLATPLDAPEVWAAGVTYQRSREARNFEAAEGRTDAETFYDKVYDAERPELFMKSTAARTVGPGERVCLRSDSSWQVPEAELGLVLDRTGAVVGYTVGNDMSCRDIEGQNPLYLPQAKIWRRSCAIGPFVRLAETVEDPYSLGIACRIYRDGAKVVEETANTSQLKRRLDELVRFLKRDNELFDGTVLLTGTCLVPPNQFTLRSGDRIEIEIEGIGTLANTAVYANEIEPELVSE